MVELSSIRAAGSGNGAFGSRPGLRREPQTPETSVSPMVAERWWATRETLRRGAACDTVSNATVDYPFCHTLHTGTDPNAAFSIAGEALPSLRRCIGIGLPWQVPGLWSQGGCHSGLSGQPRASAFRCHAGPCCVSLPRRWRLPFNGPALASLRMAARHGQRRPILPPLTRPEVPDEPRAGQSNIVLKSSSPPLEQEAGATFWASAAGTGTPSASRPPDILPAVAVGSNRMGYILS